jgi:limonene-1,2-epoxide hydrolase
MTQPKIALSRRSLIAGGGLGAVALAAANNSAQAAPTGEEAANIAVVNAFCKAWNVDALDLNKLVETYFAEGCIVRFSDSQLMATGKTATLGLFESFVGGGLRFDLKVLSTVALGPIVANLRTDSAFMPGKPPHEDAIASVFIMSGGKIKEWSDYFMKKA